jgi:hypothetical protein
MSQARSKRQRKLEESELRNWKLLAEFQRHLEAVVKQAPVSKTEMDPRRRLLSADYFSLMLFGMLNPVLKTMRGLCEASGLPRMREVCAHPVSLGSFSQMQSLVEPELLSGLLRSLAGQAEPVFGDKRLRAAVGELIATDGTLLPALPRVAWALWQDVQHRAAKLHLEFSVWRQVPVEATVTEGNYCERRAWEKKLRAGACYVSDRHYGHDYKLIERVQKRGSRHVLRLYNNTTCTVLEEPWALGPADLAAGVCEDVMVRLGSNGPPGRLVRVQADGHVFLLFTNLLDIPAELVALIYRYRWQIELFFKWLKCILGCRHWLAHSQAGITTQIYCALIAAVLMVMWSGRKPTKRQWELLQLYWLGWADLEHIQLSFLPKKNP